VIMGLVARYPIVLAPGMGENFFFVFSVLPAAAAAGSPDPWRAALGVVGISGLLFYLLYALGIREMIFDAISPSMKSAIAVGIGLFIAFIGLRNAGVIVSDPGTAVRLNASFASPDWLIFGVALLVAAALQARNVRGALLIGIAAATGLALVLRLLLQHLACAAHPLVAGSMLMNQFQPATGIVSAPPSLAPTFFKMDLLTPLTSPRLWPYVIIFLFMDTFDTVGTLIGVSRQAGFLKDNKLPRARQAMLADQAGTLVGACLGTSTVTSYIESAAGVAAGGRTGFVSLVTAALFLLALFFSPVIAMVASYPPLTAAALVLVGVMMMRNVTGIDWADFTEAVPAFLIILGIPLSYSIGDGLALGFITYPLIKFLAGRRAELTRVMIVMGGILLAYFVAVRSLV